MLVAARDAILAGGAALPYDAEVEFVAGNANRSAYFRTMIIPTSTMKIEAEVSYVSGAQNGWFFETEAQYYNTTSTTTTGNAFGFGWSMQPFRVCYGGGFTTGPSGVFPAETRMKLVFQGGLATLGGTVWADRSRSTLTQTRWLALLGNHRGSSDSVIECADTKYRLHSFKAMDNGIVLCDLQPVRIGTTGAMYDRRGVGGMNPDGSARDDGLYFNRGTGAFVIGPDK